MWNRRSAGGQDEGGGRLECREWVSDIATMDIVVVMVVMCDDMVKRFW